MLCSEYVRGLRTADLPLSTPDYFCDTRPPLRGLPLYAPFLLKHFLECPLTAPLPLTLFLPALLHFCSTHRSHVVLDVVTDGIDADDAFVDISVSNH